MRLTVHAKPYARTPLVTREGTTCTVRIDAPAEGGRANERLIELLAEHFAVPQGSVRIVSGHTARTKIVEIDGVTLPS